MNDIFLYVFDRLRKDKYPTDKTMHLNEIKCWLGVQIFPKDDLIHVYTVYLVLFSFVAE